MNDGNHLNAARETHAKNTADVYQMMDALIMQAATAVANQKYFTESWDIDDLLRMEEKLPTTYATLPNRRAGPSAPDAVSYTRWTHFKDTYMAKFFIHTNLMCWKRERKPARARSRRTFARAD